MDALENLLKETQYDPEETNFTIESFRKGFLIGYDGDKEIQRTAPNLKLECGTHQDMWNKVMKEVSLSRFVGAYEKIPFDHYIQSPLGLVPKGDNDVHLIFHLSHPRGKRKLSVNACTPKELCTVKYKDFDRAVRLCIAAGEGCYVAKSNMQSSFRNLPIKKEDWKWLVKLVEHPVTGIKYFFFDKCLPFGASISCSHFQRFSNCIVHIFRKKTGEENNNYLDDFFFIVLLKAICDGNIRAFLDICDIVKFPVSLEKAFWGGIQLSYS